jgi:hypothetical protein
MVAGARGLNLERGTIVPTHDMPLPSKSEPDWNQWLNPNAYAAPVLENYSPSRTSSKRHRNDSPNFLYNQLLRGISRTSSEESTEEWPKAPLECEGGYLNTTCSLDDSEFCSEALHGWPLDHALFAPDASAALYDATKILASNDRTTNEVDTPPASSARSCQPASLSALPQLRDFPIDQWTVRGDEVAHQGVSRRKVSTNGTSSKKRIYKNVARKKPVQPHMVIEQRYRKNLIERFNDLKQAVPTLQARLKVQGKDVHVGSLAGLEPARYVNHV